MLKFRWYEGPDGYVQAVRVSDRLEDRVAIASWVMDGGGWAETPLFGAFLILGHGEAREEVPVGAWVVAWDPDQHVFISVPDSRFQHDYHLAGDDPRNRLPDIEERFAHSKDPDIQWLLGYVHDLEESEDAYDVMFARHREILHGVAVALRGPEPKLTSWGSHDLADLAGQWRTRVERAVEVGSAEVADILRPLLADGGLRTETKSRKQA